MIKAVYDNLNSECKDNFTIGINDDVTNLSLECDDNFIINSKAKERLTENLKSSVIIVILIELIVCGVAVLLTNWIIKPVEKTFDKQKQFIEFQ